MPSDTKTLKSIKRRHKNPRKRIQSSPAGSSNPSDKNETPPDPNPSLPHLDSKTTEHILSIDKKFEEQSDIVERDALAKRILKKDQERKEALKNKLSAEQKAEKIEEEKRRGLLGLTEEEKQRLLPQTRELSRQVYLEKRKLQQLELTRRRVADEERLFGEEALTAEERNEILRSKAAIRFAEEREELKKVKYFFRKLLLI